MKKLASALKGVIMEKKLESALKEMEGKGAGRASDKEDRQKRRLQEIQSGILELRCGGHRPSARLRRAMRAVRAH